MKFASLPCLLACLWYFQGAEALTCQTVTGTPPLYRTCTDMWTNKLPELMHPASDFYPFNASTADDFRVLAALDMDGADMLTDTKWAAGLFVWRDWVNANGGLCLNASSYQYDHKPGGCKTGQGKKVRVVVFDMRHGGTYAQAKPLMQNFFGTHCVHPSTVKPHLFVLPYGGTVVEDIGSYIT